MDQPAHPERFSSILDLTRQLASPSSSLVALQRAVVKAISEGLPHYWAGFYMLDLHSRGFCRFRPRFLEELAQIVGNYIALSRT